MKKRAYKSYFYDKKLIDTQETFNEFNKKYTFNNSDCQIPVIISIFAQESESFNDNSFVISLENEIKNVKRSVGSSPVYFLMQVNNDSEEKIAEYLLNNNYNVIIVGKTEKNPFSDEVRYIRTENPTDYMLDCCWTMFAFWDGDVNSKSGKYVENAVKKLLKGLRDKESNINDYNIRFPNQCEIVHFLLKRDDMIVKEFDIRYLYAHYAETGTGWYYVNKENYKDKEFKKGGRKAKDKKKAIDKQNSQLRLLNSSLKEYNINPKNKVDNILPFAYEDNERINDIRKKFAFYDAFAIENQKKRLKQSKRLIFIAALALISFGAFSDLVSWWWILVLYAVLFVFAFILYLKTNKSRTHENYIIGRVLSETMRVQAFWYAIGIDKSARTNYPVSHRSKLEWLYRSVTAIHVVNKSLGGDIGNPDDKELADHVKALWIGKEEYDENTHEDTIYNIGQLKYFHNGFNNKLKSYNKSKKVSKFVSVISFILTIFLVFAVVITRFFSFDFINQPSLDKAVVVAVFLIGIFPVIIAAVSTSLIVKSYKEEFESHSWSLKLTKRALTDLDLRKDKEMTQKILEEYGTQMLNENGDWALMKFEHRPEIIKN